MNRETNDIVKVAGLAILTIIMAISCAATDATSSKVYERSFTESPVAIKQILQRMQSSIGGRLPVVDGFASAGERPAERYQRAYFQMTVQVSPKPGGGSVVRVAAKVTAWYADPVPSGAGYQLLPSNGRLESDLLDELSRQVAAVAGNPGTAAKQEVSTTGPAHESGSTPTAGLPESPHSSPLSLTEALAASGEDPPPPNAPRVSSPARGLQAEAEQLRELLKSQSHPNNLAAVKKSGTAVVSAPSLTAKTLFLASAHDEFEILNFNQDWVHVRISGLSRGWIWRNALEMPGSIPDTQSQSPASDAADSYRVSREETAQFPGDWEPLRGKNVKIFSLQETDEVQKGRELQMKLEFAKSLLKNKYEEVAQKTLNLAGIVLIFDSADGGMIAATLPAIEQWKTGALSDSAFWHQCFFDPPETPPATGSSGSQ